MAERPGLVVDVASDADRVVAGEDIVVRVTISSSVPLSRVAVWFPHQGFAQVVEPADGRLVWVTAIGRQPVSVVARLQSVRWGIEALGPAPPGGGRTVRVGALDRCTADDRDLTGVAR